MAKWSVSASTVAETQQAQHWAMEAHNEARVNSFWSNHISAIGSGMNIITEDPRLERQPGDAVNSNLVVDLSGAGRAHSEALEGSEDTVTVYSDSVLLGRLRNAIRMDSTLDEQRSSFDVREQMSNLLSYWASRYLFDKWIFDKMSGSTVQSSGSTTIGEAASANTNILYANSKQALGELEAGDTFTLDLLSRAKTAAMVGQLNGSTIYKIKPLIIDGQPYYIYVDRPEARFAMRQTTEWIEAQKLARQRSLENPIFNGADGIWDGVILKFHDLVTTGSDAGAGGNVSYSNGLFLGAQAGTLFPAQPAPDWVEKTFDYGEEYGIATGMTQGFDKLQYNSIDFGVIAIRSALVSI